jgi:hypothetical protein
MGCSTVIEALKAAGSWPELDEDDLPMLRALAVAGGHKDVYENLIEAINQHGDITLDTSY